MANILICVPSTREYKPFLESYSKFLEEVKKKHTIIEFFVKNKKLVDVQNESVQKLLSGNFDYLLFLDDDHSGHTSDMLECLIGANTYMATIKTYIRHYPYMSALMRMNENGIWVGIENGQGYEDIDGCGFPMTLIRKDLFYRLEKPYFREFQDGTRNWSTDGEFCDRLRSIGIKPKGCFQYCLAHGDITEDNVRDMRLKNSVSTQNRMMELVYNKLQGDLLCWEKQ